MLIGELEVAIGKHDSVLWEKLLHPDILAAASDEQKTDFYHQYFVHSQTPGLRSPYSFSCDNIDAKQLLESRGQRKERWIVLPTVAVHLRFRKSTDSSVVVTYNAVRRGEKWCLVYPLPAEGTTDTDRGSHSETAR